MPIFRERAIDKEVVSVATRVLSAVFRMRPSVDRRSLQSRLPPLRLRARQNTGLVHLDLSRVADEIVEILEDELELGFFDILPELERRLPARTGRLRAAATVLRRPVGVVIGIDPEVAEYAPYVRYRNKRFGSRTVIETLDRFRNSAPFRAAVRKAVRQARAKI